MLSVLLPLAEAAGHAAGAHPEAASGIAKIFSDFGIDVPSVLAQALNFSIVAFLLWRFAFKPVLATLDQRQKTIEAGLKNAEEIKARLAATQQETMQVLQKAHADAAAFIDQARRTAKEISDREAQAATERTNEMLAKASQAIELERRKMMQEVRAEVTRLVVTTTQRVLARELTEAERSRFNGAAARELTEV